MLARISARSCGLLLLAGFLFSVCVPARAQTQQDLDSVTRMLQASGYSYQASSMKNVWFVDRPGTHMKNIRVILSIGGDPSILVTFVIVARKQQLPDTTAFMRMLLKENHDLDYVKVGYDADGDLFVRTDSKPRITDAQELKELIEQVELSADQIYGDIQGQLLK